ncbi:hypothetical protein [Bacillus altitudinis]|uniref:hypothetical protein n=1 Tax=Bacillus altitudinis TaxID=293387 RepID=UPI00119F58E4|nr:hypothetical protein [Bacillus altitudinis]
MDEGEIWVDGKKGVIKKGSDGVKVGMGFMREDGKDEGVMVDGWIGEKMGLGKLERLCGKGVMDKKKEEEFVDVLMKGLTIKTA